MNYRPSDIYYHDNNKEFWTEWYDFSLSRTERIITRGKTKAYQIATKRTNEYAENLDIQLKFYVSTLNQEFNYRSNDYLTKIQRIKKNRKANKIQIIEKNWNNIYDEDFIVYLYAHLENDPTGASLSEHLRGYGK